MSRSSSPLPLWGGFECTVNRVGDRYFDQTVLSNHDSHPEDLDLLAGLGLQAIRYPVIWERTEDPKTRELDWRFPDERLSRLRELGMVPIVGLVHHGSGPAYTSLLDPAFPELLAGYAFNVATRFPWLDAYTPVNEPMTTARFSCLYGHWYPHGRDQSMWARALVTQAKAIVLSMQAIRAVNPAARLIQTDDLGKVSSTSVLRYQADLENERRWLGWDLICGAVTNDHPFWTRLLGLDVPLRDLEWLAANPCPPDIIGINYYPSSERFLDHRLHLYPDEPHGGNGRHSYVDVLAARTCREGIYGPETLLVEAWERYGLPVAITECHNGGPREEQLRWLVEVWKAANRARVRGVDVRALTVWALFGSYDWDRLVTVPHGYYEPGLFDLRFARPRKTALARPVRALGHARELDMPALDRPGWWRRPDRFRGTVSRVAHPGLRLPTVEDHALPPDRAIFITGKDGPIKRALTSALRSRALDYRIAHSSSELIAPLDAVLPRPWAVINTDVAGSASHPMRRREAELAHRQASVCRERGIYLVVLSFPEWLSAANEAPHAEQVDPDVDAVGSLQEERDRVVMNVWPEALIIRPRPPLSHDVSCVGSPLRTFSQEVNLAGQTSRWSVTDLINVALDLLIDGEKGLWHVVVSDVPDSLELKVA